MNLVAVLDFLVVANEKFANELNHKTSNNMMSYKFT